ncbi:MAG: alpha/beta fold hydrolase [Thermomicrobiales bacterium]
MRLALGLIVGTLIVMVASTAILGDAHRLAEGIQEHHEIGDFYDVPSPIPPGAPGEIVRSQPLLSAPHGAHAWRVLYHSRDVHGADIVVSGVIIAPDGTAPATGRTIVSWGHPTTGAAPHCAPSLAIDPFDLIEGLSDLLRSGYVVAATDYAGMGVSTPNSYLIGQTEGQNMLDAARAARTIADTGAGNRLVLWGHSQGGQAALFAAELAGTYAPEFDLLAVAVAAPATNIGALFDADLGDVSGVTIGAYALTAYGDVYASTPGVRLESILTPQGLAAARQIEPMCLLSETKQIHAIATPVVGAFVTSNPVTTEPWSRLLAENTPGSRSLNVPLLIVQGESDTLVRPEITAAFVDHEREIGTRVTYLTFPHIDHGLIAMVALPEVMKWLREVGA